MRVVNAYAFDEVGTTLIKSDSSAEYIGVGVLDDRPVIFVEENELASANSEFSVISIQTGSSLPAGYEYLEHVGNLNYRGRNIHVYWSV